MGGFAWVTLATNDTYSLGALVLAYSLRQVRTIHQLVVLVTPGVTDSMRSLLATVFDVVSEVNILDSKDEANLLLLQRPELGVTFTKLHCWRLTQFEKCVFLDADTLVLRNCDELFEREEFSAAPDVGWPDCFNSGVFVYRPSDETYKSLVKFALEKGSFDGGDQGLLNMYFSDWAYKDISKHLPFIYNMCSTATYSYLPAFKQYGGEVRIIHFIGASKPWLQYFNSESLQVVTTSGFEHLQTVLQQWWHLFCSQVHSKLTPTMARTNTSVASSCTSPFHPLTYDNESKCENSLRTEQVSTSFSNDMPVWDPWENYEPAPDPLHNSEAEVFTLESHIHSDTNESMQRSSAHEQQTNNTNAINLHVNNNEFTDNIPSNINENSINYSYNKVYNHSNDINVDYHFQSTASDQYFQESDHVQPNKTRENKNSFEQNKYFDSGVIHTYTTHLNRQFDENQCLHVPTCSSTSVNSSPNTYQSQESSCPSVFQRHDQFLSPNIECDHKSANAVTTEQTSLTVAYVDSNEADMDENSGLAGALAQVTLGEPRSPSQLALEENLRRQGWEVGNIDYLGRDSFDNIWKKICETLANVPEPTDAKKESLPVKEQPAAAIPPVSLPADDIPTGVKQIALDTPAPDTTTTTVETQKTAELPITTSIPVTSDSTIVGSQIQTETVTSSIVLEPTDTTGTAADISKPAIATAPVQVSESAEVPLQETDAAKLVQQETVTPVESTKPAPAEDISVATAQVQASESAAVPIQQEIVKPVESEKPVSAEDVSKSSIATEPVQVSESAAVPVQQETVTPVESAKPVSAEDISKSPIATAPVQAAESAAVPVQQETPVESTKPVPAEDISKSPIEAAPVQPSEPAAVPAQQEIVTPAESAKPVPTEDISKSSTAAAPVQASESAAVPVQQETVKPVESVKPLPAEDVSKSSVATAPVQVPESAAVPIQQEIVTPAESIKSEETVPTETSKAEVTKAEAKSTTEKETVAVIPQKVEESTPVHSETTKTSKSKEKSTSKSKSKDSGATSTSDTAKQAPTPPPRKGTKNGGTGVTKKSPKKK